MTHSDQPELSRYAYLLHVAVNISILERQLCNWLHFCNYNRMHHSVTLIMIFGGSRFMADIPNTQPLALQ